MATVKKIPQRQCIGCGQMKDKKDLIRILKTQDESIVIDATGRKNGRGVTLLPYNRRKGRIGRLASRYRYDWCFR